jgi:hypothetical protein
MGLQIAEDLILLRPDQLLPPVASPHSRLYSDWDSEPPVSAPRIQW